MVHYDHTLLIMFQFIASDVKLDVKHILWKVQVVNVFNTYQKDTEIAKLTWDELLILVLHLTVTGFKT